KAFGLISEGKVEAQEIIRVADGYIEAPRYLALRGKRTLRDIATITTMVMYRRAVLLIDPMLKGEMVKHFGFGSRWKFDARAKARLRQQSKAIRAHAFKYIDAVPSGFDWPRQTWDVANRDLKELDRICAELKKLKYQPSDGPNRLLSSFERHYVYFMQWI